MLTRSVSKHLPHELIKSLFAKTTHTLSLGSTKEKKVPCLQTGRQTYVHTVGRQPGTPTQVTPKLATLLHSHGTRDATSLGSRFIKPQCLSVGNATPVPSQTSTCMYKGTRKESPYGAQSEPRPGPGRAVGRSHHLRPQVRLRYPGAGTGGQTGKGMQAVCTHCGHRNPAPYLACLPSWRAPKYCVWDKGWYQHRRTRKGRQPRS